MFTVVSPDKYPESDTAYHALFFPLPTNKRWDTALLDKLLSLFLSYVQMYLIQSFCLLLQTIRKSLRVTSIPSSNTNIPRGTTAQIGPRLLQHTQLDTSIPWDFQLLAKAATYQQTQEKKNIHALSEIRTRDLSNEAAAGLLLRTHGHQDRLNTNKATFYSTYSNNCTIITVLYKNVSVPQVSAFSGHLQRGTRQRKLQ